MLERGLARALRLGDVDDVVAALDGRLDVRMFWHGPDLDRLLDAGHAALAASVKRRLERWGWLVRVEVSYSRYGERGRIDLLAWHPGTGILLVLELKTELVDVQALLGSLDVKARLAPHVAERFGWEVSAVVPGIVFAEDRTTRWRLAQLDTLFDAYPTRGREAIAWLQRPHPPAPGVLWFAPLATGVPSVRQRVRPTQSRHMYRGRAIAEPTWDQIGPPSVGVMSERPESWLTLPDGADGESAPLRRSSARGGGI